VKLKRSGAAAVGFVAVGALLLSGCGSNSNGSSSGGGGSSAACGKKALKASGSTAQANAMTTFIAAYEAACSGNTLDYTANGSGAGVTEFNGNQTDFAGSDSPLSPDKGEVAAAAKRCGSPAWDLPVVFGPIAVTYNLPGVTTLNLDGASLAKIFSGAITTWNDPAIAALNSGTKLPSTKIDVLFRSDQSGTTDNFQKYLTGASDGVWTKGVGKTFNGGVGSGASGNAGTAAALKSTEGAITYNEYSFAKANSLSYAQIVTSASKTPVAITPDSVAATVNGATVKGTGNDLVLDTSTFYKPTDAAAYPIVLATYEIVCSKYADADTGKAVKAFLNSTIGAGQGGLSAIGYFPLPDSFKAKLQTAITALS
jgi:phosphate transport system substrate-binding protein